MDVVAAGYSAADLFAFASAARRMRRCWYLGVEKNDVGTVKRVLNCSGVYHVHPSDWRQSAPGGLIEPIYSEPGNCRPWQPLMCGNRRCGPLDKLWFLIGVKTQFLSIQQRPPKMPPLQGRPRPLPDPFFILFAAQQWAAPNSLHIHALHYAT